MRTTTAIFIAALAATSAFAADPESTGRDRAAQPAIQPAVDQKDLDARTHFLAVEKFARLPAAEQTKNLESFYRDKKNGLNSLYLGMLSSHPDNILDRKTFKAPDEPTVRWASQLETAAATMSAEEVADKLASRTWINVATYVRIKAVFQAHTVDLEPLLTKDLASEDPADFNRACNAIAELKLQMFTSKILDIYLADGKHAKRTFTTLIWLRDPEITKRLLADVEKNPKSIIRHAGLFQGPLYNEKAHPSLLKLLDSDDAEIRHSAAYALMECKDSALAKPIAKLAKEKSPATVEIALLMSIKLGDNDFETIRDDLTPLLQSAEATVQLNAIKAFASHKDLAAAGIIRVFLSKPKIDPGEQVTIMQALNALTDSTFNYDMHNWGPEKNHAAIDKFDAWILSQKKAP